MHLFQIKEKINKHLPLPIASLSLLLIAGFFAIWLCNMLFISWIPLQFALTWNLLLAVLPLLFALILTLLHRRHKKGPLPWLCGVLWLLFLPNAPYLFTDLIHLDFYTYDFGYTVSPPARPWLWLGFLVAVLLIGTTCGSLSIFLLHRIVSEKRGNVFGWLFCGIVCLLAGAGVYIGRFMRFNSWDVFHKLGDFIDELLSRLGARSIGFTALFAGLTALCYILFYVTFHASCTQESKNTSN